MEAIFRIDSARGFNGPFVHVRKSVHGQFFVGGIRPKPRPADGDSAANRLVRPKQAGRAHVENRLLPTRLKMRDMCAMQINLRTAGGRRDSDFRQAAVTLAKLNFGDAEFLLQLIDVGCAHSTPFCNLAGDSHTRLFSQGGKDNANCNANLDCYDRGESARGETDITSVFGTDVPGSNPGGRMFAL